MGELTRRVGAHMGLPECAGTIACHCGAVYLSAMLWSRATVDSFLAKVVRGLIPAIPANEFLTPIRSKRLITPRNQKDFRTTNLVTTRARNNSHCFSVDSVKTAEYKNSFFFFFFSFFSRGLPSTGTILMKKP